MGGGGVRGRRENEKKGERHKSRVMATATLPRWVGRPTSVCERCFQCRPKKEKKRVAVWHVLIGGAIGIIVQFYGIPTGYLSLRA